MKRKIRTKLKKNFDFQDIFAKVKKNPYSSSKKGCFNILEVISFFIIIFLVLGFVTFCQKQDNYSKMISPERVV